MYMKAPFSDEEITERKACRHSTESAKYLSYNDTPHIQSPETLTVRVSIFLCNDCGGTFSVYTEIPRGYLADGTITTKMEDEIRNIQIEKKAEERAIELNNKSQALAKSSAKGV
jgi:hypothetical protein